MPNKDINDLDCQINNLKTYAAALNIILPEDINCDGQIHRFCSHGRKTDKAEWYSVAVEDGLFIAGFFGSWRGGLNSHTFRPNKPGGVSIEEYNRRFEEYKKQTDAKLTQIHEEAIKKAGEIWEKESPAKYNHPYLAKKKIKPHVIKQDALDRLIIPVMDENNNIKSLQFIDPQGNKSFLTGGQVKGHFYLLQSAKQSDKIFVAEGYATAGSILEATKVPTAIAFSCSNLVAVGIKLNHIHKDKHIVLCADLGDASDEVIDKWKELVSPFVKQPEDLQQGTDFNDLAVEKGLPEVAKQLKQIAYHTLSIADFMKRDIKELEFIAKPLILKGSENLIYGPGGIGKSYLCYEMAFACALGLPFLKWDFAKSKTLIIDGEMIDSEIKERLDTIIKRITDKGKNQDLDESMLTIMTTEMLNEKENGLVDLYSERSRKLLDPIIAQFDVIFFDNYLNLTGAGPGDNYAYKPESWAQIHRWLKPYKCQGKTFIFAHHSNAEGKYYGTKRMSADMVSIISLEKPKTNEVVEEGHTTLCFKFVIEKARYIPQYEKLPFIVKINQVNNKLNWVVENPLIK